MIQRRSTGERKGGRVRAGCKFIFYWSYIRKFLRKEKTLSCTKDFSHTLNNAIYTARFLIFKLKLLLVFDFKKHFAKDFSNYFNTDHYWPFLHVSFLFFIVNDSLTAFKSKWTILSFEFSDVISNCCTIVSSMEWNQWIR